jgi:formylglycine-generating enzyme required for sulfatase activity
MSVDPMVEVSWYGAVAYCNWRSSEEGYQACYNLSDPNWSCDFSKSGYRLPTEAEWEYAARGGENSPYYRFPWGDEINHDYANYRANGSAYSYDTSPYTTYTYHPDWNDGIYPYTSVVGSFASNGYGLYDMAGNVWEWCNDWYDRNYYDVSPYNNPQGPASSPDDCRVLRGGSWDINAGYCRVAHRYDYGYPDARSYVHGFRIVLDLN